MRNRGAARTVGLILTALLVGGLLFYWSYRELRHSPKPNRPMIPTTTSSQQ